MSRLLNIQQVLLNNDLDTAQLFINTSNVSLTNVSCPLGI